MTVIVKYSKVFLVCSLLVAVFFLMHIPKVRNVEDVDHFIIKDDPDSLFYDRFKEIFGNDEFFIIAFSRPDLFSPGNLSLIGELTEELEKIEDIREVKSLLNVDDTIGSPDYFEVRRFIEDIPDDQNELSDLKSRAVANALYRDNLISEDGTTTAIVVSAYHRPEDDRYRHRLMAQVYAVLEKYKDRAGKFYLSGKTVTDTTMSEYMEGDVSLLLPVSYILITLCLFYFYRNFFLTILGIVNISFCLGSVMGFMGLTGITQNSVTSIVLPLVMALALCDTVHLFSHMTEDELRQHRTREAALSSVISRVITPCLMTSLTTGIGFLSLLVSRIPPIREFAVTASVGMAFEFFYSFFLLPPLILLFNPSKIYKNYHAKSFVERFLNGVSALVFKKRRMIVISGVVLMGACLVLSSQIKVETNIFDFFKKDSEIRNALKFVESRLAGVESFDISIRSDQVDAFKSPDNLKIIQQIQAFCGSVDGIDKSLSLVDFIKDMNESFHNEDRAYYVIPDSQPLISQYLLLYDSDELEDYVNPSYDQTRISLRVFEHNSSKQKVIFNKIEAYLQSVRKTGLDIRITGRVLQDLNIIEDIFEGQIKSLILAGIVIWAVLFVLFRSFRMGLISIVPNLFPIIMNFGIMGLFSIPLNTATALIAAVAIGIAVDDTIHFLTEFNKQSKDDKDVNKVIDKVIHRKGRAIFSSSFILCIGFGVLTLSSFIPTIHFGLLSAGIMISAVIADTLLLPAMLLYMKNDPDVINKIGCTQET